MSSSYKGSATDTIIIRKIAAHLAVVLNESFGDEAALTEHHPEIYSYTNSFFLRFATKLPGNDNSHVLVKIRRHPKMLSLQEAISTPNIHTKMQHEFSSQQDIYELFKTRSDGLRAVRPLAFMAEFHALLMLEFEGSTLRELLMSAAPPFRSQERKRSMLAAAYLSGKWLRELHAGLDGSFTTEFSREHFDQEINPYLEELESCGIGTRRLDSLKDHFEEMAPKLEGRQLLSCNSHEDFTSDNIIYNHSGELVVIDIKIRMAPAYRDLTLLMVHADTYRVQLMSFGKLMRKPVLQDYRHSILKGYFEDDKPDWLMLDFYCARNVLDKWLMYERIMQRHTGIKGLRSSLIAPLIRSYFQRTTLNFLDMSKGK